MRKFRAFQLIKSLTNKELKNFKLYLSSPYHCQNPELLKLVEILEKVARRKEVPAELPFTPLALYEELFTDGDSPKRSYRLRKVMKAISGLALHFENFIAIEQLQNDQMKKLHYVNQFLSERGHHKALDLSMNKWKRQIYQEKDTIDKYINHYHCYLTEFESFHTDRLKLARTERYLEGMDQQATLIYWYARLSYLCNQVYRSPILKNPPKPDPVIQAALDGSQVIRSYNGHFPTIEMYRQLLQLGQKLGQYPTYQSCRQFLSDHLSQIAPKESLVLFHYLLNYCQSSYSSGLWHFLEESFYLIDWARKKNILSEKESISDAFFINNGVTLIAVRKNIAEVNAYIDQYADFIPEEYREDAVNIVQAYLHFHHQDLESAREKLSKVKQRNSNYMVRIYSLEVRIFYQLYTRGSIALRGLRAKLAACKKYFKSKTVPLSRTKKESYIKLAGYIQEMIHFHKGGPKGTAAYLQKLKQNLEQDAVPGKDWLKKELEQLRPIDR